MFVSLKVGMLNIIVGITFSCMHRNNPIIIRVTAMIPIHKIISREIAVKHGGVCND